MVRVMTHAWSLLIVRVRKIVSTVNVRNQTSVMEPLTVIQDESVSKVNVRIIASEFLVRVRCSAREKRVNVWRRRPVMAMTVVSKAEYVKPMRVATRA